MYCDWCDNVGKTYAVKDCGQVCYECFCYALSDLKINMQVRVKPYFTSDLVRNAKYTIDNIRIADSYSNDAWITFKGYNKEYHYTTLALKPV